ncbi:MAG: carbohydrate ABC transporter permease [Ruminococcaceae bacterium]|nr:carbohydrate ABC transporter permease [Oscillospiraceae bacterium]
MAKKVKRLRVRKHRVVLNRSAGGDTAITIMLIILGALMFLPMYYTVITAFKPLGELSITPPKMYVMKPTFKNFIDLFTNMNQTWVPISRYIFNTVYISVASTAGALILGSMTAYALSKIRMPGYKALNNIIVYSLMIGSTITGTYNFIIYVYLGMLNTYSISILPVWASTLGLYLMKNFIDDGISDEMIEAARIDGAKELYIYWKIAMPLVKPAWLTLIVTTFQSVWNAGASVYVWSEQLKTFNAAVAQITGAAGANVGAATAGSVLMMSVPIIVFVVNQSQIVETMASSGMKD